MAATPAFKGLGQKDGSEFEIYLGYTASEGQLELRVRLVLKKEKNLHTSGETPARVVAHEGVDLNSNHTLELQMRACTQTAKSKVAGGDGS